MGVQNPEPAKKQGPRAGPLLRGVTCGRDGEARYHTIRMPALPLTDSRSCSVPPMSVLQPAEAHNPTLGAMLAVKPPPSSKVVDRCRLTISVRSL